MSLGLQLCQALLLLKLLLQLESLLLLLALLLLLQKPQIDLLVLSQCLHRTAQMEQSHIAPIKSQICRKLINRISLTYRAANQV